MIVKVIYGLWLRALHLLGKNRSLGDNVRIVDIESICKKVWTILGSQYSIQVCVRHNKCHRKDEGCAKDKRLYAECATFSRAFTSSFKLFRLNYKTFPASNSLLKTFILAHNFSN